MKTQFKNQAVYLLTVSLLCACNSSNSDFGVVDSSPSYEQNLMNVEQQEMQNPIQFLDLETTYLKNLVGQWVIEGSIANTATVAAYKDVKIEITFYSKTQSLMRSERITVYEFIKAGGRKSFKEKINGYKKASSVRCYVVGAK